MNPSSVASTPLTFRGPATLGPPPVADAAGIDRADTAPAQVLEIERYDTADLRLAAAGIVLAVHRDAQPTRWELRTPGESEPLRLPAGADSAGGLLPVPAEIVELVRGVTRGRKVRPVGRVRTVRTEHRLLDADGGVLATMNHDAVTLSTLGRSTDVDAWTEITVDAAPPLRDDLAARATAAGLRPGEPGAATELAGRLRPRPRRRTTLPKGSAGANLVAYLGEQVDRLATEDLRVRRGEPDSIHQLRVASRRLRSALQGYRRLLDRERTDPLVDALRQLGRDLAAARDAEVLRERIVGGLHELPDDLRPGDVVGVATRYFARIEAEGTAAALTTLDGPDYTRLRDALDRLVAEPPLTRRAARPAAAELPRHVARAERKLGARVALALDPDLPAERRDDAIHAARKAGKRLRYLTEVARPAVGKAAKRHGKAVKGIQKALGEHQDTVVARGALRSLGVLAYAENDNGFAFGVLHGLDTATAERIESSLPGLWKAASKKKLRRWLR